MKTCCCSTCPAGGQPQPLENFTKDKSRVDGLNPWCRPCTRAAGRRWHAKSKDSVSARKAAQYKAERERFLARNNRWRAQNRELELETNRRYYWNNVEQVAEWHKLYYEANKDAANERVNRRRARLLAATTIPFTVEQLAQRWAYYGNRCWICREPATATDHVKPLSKSGAHMLCNLRPICKPCNSSKHDKWPYPTLARAA